MGHPVGALARRSPPLPFTTYTRSTTMKIKTRIKAGDTGEAEQA
ncbi:MAG: hypothetical protein R3B09_08700 [Nannocystaceae bacterium]